MDIPMDESILKKACLVQLATSSYTGSKKLDPETMSKIGNAEWLAGRKHLINPEVLTPPKQVIARARKMIGNYTLPFPITSLSLIPFKSVRKVNETLDELKKEFGRTVEEVADRYYGARREAEDQLGDLYNETDYPRDIRSKYGFEWRFITLDVPGKGAFIDPEIYEREMEKFQNMMQEAQELGVNALRVEFAEMVDHMVDRLTPGEDGRLKKFKPSLVQNFNEFFETFVERNVFVDSELKALVDKAQETLQGVNPDTLRHVDDARQKVKEAMEKIKDTIDSNMQLAPRRKLRLDDDAREEAA